VLFADPSDIRKAGARYLLECRNREAHQFMAGTRQIRYPALTHLLVPFFKGLIADMHPNHPAM
jgi:hypothetical protein